jgi:hypothetical protein
LSNFFKYTVRFLIGLFLSATGPARAVLPISHYHDLVAGEGARGYRDGPFFSALFNFPQGLAIDPDGKFLYVADRDNHRIRVVLLDEANRVETLAGTGSRGSADGGFSRAEFNRPAALALISKNQLAVYDSGNRKLRLVDLSRKTVTTLAGNGADGFTDGKALQASLGGVANIVYFPPEGALYFSQPAYGALRRLDLSQGKISTVLREDPRLSRPRALCLFQNHVCVAGDGFKEPVYLLEAAPSSPGSFDLRPIGIGTRVLALGSSDGALYAMQSGSLEPWAKIYPPLPDGGDFNLRSVWGGILQYIPSQSDPFLWSNMDDQAGIAADPGQPKRFFVSSGYLQSIVSLKDYSFDGLIRGLTKNQEGLRDFEYPLAKPPKTFRILVVGNSYVFYQAAKEDRRWGWSGSGGSGNRMESMPKRLELLLNTEACLRDVPEHFEVLNLSNSTGAGPSYLWLRYEAPGLIQKYDIDMVLYFVISSSADVDRFFSAYFQRPLTPAGIPQEAEDPEYLLKPWREKIPRGLPGDFYRYASSKGWVQPLSNNQFSFAEAPTFLEDPAAQLDIEKMAGKPIGTFQRELKKLRTKSGHRIRFEMCFLPIRDAESSNFRTEHLDELRTFWRGTALQAGAPFLDLTAPFVALEKTYWPIDESGLGQHLDSNGHFLFAYILTRELIDHGLVPFRVPPATQGP